MASSRQGLRDDRIFEYLVNTNESDCEDLADDDLEEDLEIRPEDVEEEVVPPSSENEWNDSDDEPLASFVQHSCRRARNRHLLWVSTEDFDNNVGDPPLEQNELPSLRSSHEYFQRYISPQFFKSMSECTNICSSFRTGKSLNSTAQEMAAFIGCSMVIGLLGLPRIRMYWAQETRITLVSEAMTRNRYFQLRSNIKIVNDQKVTNAMKEVDKFWKIRPIVSQIEQACRENKREKNVAIDEQIIPFTGKFKLKQVIKGKPNPEGIKVFLMTNPNGLPLDLYLYQGQGTSLDSALYPMPEKIDLGGRVVLKFADTLPINTSIYFDRYFTSITLLETLSERNINGTGTLMKNRVPEYQRPHQKKKKQKFLLKTDRMLQKTGRGSYDCVVRQDKKIAVIKWLDSKPIHLASTESAVQPIGSCQRWSKKDQKYIDLPQPIAIKKYNSYMGGIDLLDRIIGKYPMRGRTGKWTVRAIFHFFDFAAAAAWIEYRQDAVKCELPRKHIKQYLDFKMDLAKYLIYGNEMPTSVQCVSPILDRVTRNSPSLSERQSPISRLQVPTTSTRKQRLVEPIPHIAKRSKQAQHLPVYANEDQNNRSKCRFSGCRQLTFVKCSDCNIFLCFNSNRNCFYDFHTKKD